MHASGPVLVVGFDDGRQPFGFIGHSVKTGEASGGEEVGASHGVDVVEWVAGKDLEWISVASVDVLAVLVPAAAVSAAVASIVGWVRTRGVRR